MKQVNIMHACVQSPDSPTLQKQNGTPDTLDSFQEHLLPSHYAWVIPTYPHSTLLLSPMSHWPIASTIWKTYL